MADSLAKQGVIGLTLLLVTFLENFDCPLLVVSVFPVIEISYTTALVDVQLYRFSSCKLQQNLLLPITKKK